MQAAIRFSQPAVQRQVACDLSRTSTSSGPDELRELDGASTSKTGHFGRWGGQCARRCTPLQLTVVFADEELVASAAQAAARFRLPGYDAIQLAAASRSGCDLFLCSDARLLEAAHG